MHGIRRMPLSLSVCLPAPLATKARRKHTWQLRQEEGEKGGRVTYREPSEREKLQWTVKLRFQLIPPNAACLPTYALNTVFKLT